MILEELAPRPIGTIEALQYEEKGQIRMLSHARACFAPGWLHLKTRPHGQPVVKVLPSTACSTPEASGQPDGLWGRRAPGPPPEVVSRGSVVLVGSR